MHRVQVLDKDLYQMLLAEERYSFRRDNGCVMILTEHIKNNLPKMSIDFKTSTAQQLIEEIIGALKCPALEGARKHIFKHYNKETNSYRISYISDYDYQRNLDYYSSVGNHAISTNVQTTDEPDDYVSPDLAFEDESD